MRRLWKRPPVILLVASLAAAGCDTEPSKEDLLGSWAGSMTHDGEEQPIALEVEPAAEGEVSLRLTVPAMNMARQPMGAVEPAIEGSQVTLGPFIFQYDARADELRGTMPAALVPVYEIPVTLRRVKTVQPPGRPEPEAPLAEPEWTFDAGAALWPGATFANGVVYAGDDAGHLHALDARSGDERWIFEAEGPIRTRATVVHGGVFFQADDGRLYRLDATKGEEIWSVPLVEGPVERRPPGDPESQWDFFASGVSVAGDRLFVGTHDGRVVALNAGDGKRIWTHSADGPVLAAPAADSGRVFFGSFDGHVQALDAETGEPLWDTDTKGAVLSTPAVTADRVIVGNRAYDLLALEAATGEVAWKDYIWFSWVESSATVRGGVAYVGSSDAAAVFAVDADTGKGVWKTDVHGWAWGQPAVTEDRVYVGTAAQRGYQGDLHRGGVFALDRSTGAPLWRYAPTPPEEGFWGFPGSPAVGGGNVFVTGLDGRVLAFANSPPGE
jgi:outer membrane protein assembly factor BamB